jgi:tetrachloro-p-hydroquinone reductive dehalogenase
MVELFHFPPSLCSQKVRLALAEKGVVYDARLVNIGPVLENYEPWYARIKSLRRVDRGSRPRRGLL